jgi:hypothetical protein
MIILIYYKALNNNDFIIYKDNSKIILQSSSHAKIQMKLGSIIFCDAIFFMFLIFVYQLFITGIYSSTTHSYYTTYFIIMNSKKEKRKYKNFWEINANIKHYLDIREDNIVEAIHNDFEYAINNSCGKIYPNVKSKLCIF